MMPPMKTAIKRANIAMVMMMLICGAFLGSFVARYAALTYTRPWAGFVSCAAAWIYGDPAEGVPGCPV